MPTRLDVYGIGIKIHYQEGDMTNTLIDIEQTAKANHVRPFTAALWMQADKAPPKIGGCFRGIGSLDEAITTVLKQLGSIQTDLQTIKPDNLIDIDKHEIKPDESAFDQFVAKLYLAHTTLNRMTTSKEMKAALVQIEMKAALVQTLDELGCAIVARKLVEPKQEQSLPRPIVVDLDAEAKSKGRAYTVEDVDGSVTRYILVTDVWRVEVDDNGILKFYSNASATELKSAFTKWYRFYPTGT